MHISTREEATVPEQTNEPETLEPQPDSAEPASTPVPEAGQPETQEQEITALVPTEPEVIEGEVVELESLDSPERSVLPKQKPYWLLIPFAMLLCLLFLAGSYLLLLLTPSATVTILPVERSLSLTTAIQAHGRLLPPLTLAQSATVPATGKRHQDATEAHGTITFYNGLLSRQTIAFGTILTGADGVQIITDQAARIPPASNTTPPTFGQVTVEAHAVQPGVSGNIASYDINGSCCGASILVKNTTAFPRGQNASDDTVVTRADVQNAASPLQATLLMSEQAALQAQLHPAEQLFTPSCSHQIKSDHRPGQEAEQVTVTVSDTCKAAAYDAHTLYANATQMIPKTAQQRFGTGYTLLGDISTSVVHLTITDQARGMATLVVKLDATCVYQLSLQRSSERWGHV
jgi:hypothetical protein